MNLNFSKCETCIVQANCGSPCKEYKDYILEKTGIELAPGCTVNRRFLENLLKASTNIKIYGQKSYTMDLDLEEFEKC